MRTPARPIAMIAASPDSDEQHEHRPRGRGDRVRARAARAAARTCRRSRQAAAGRRAASAQQAKLRPSSAIAAGIAMPTSSSGSVVLVGRRERFGGHGEHVGARRAPALDQLDQQEERARRRASRRRGSTAPRAVTRRVADADRGEQRAGRHEQAVAREPRQSCEASTPIAPNSERRHAAERSQQLPSAPSAAPRRRRAARVAARRRRRPWSGSRTAPPPARSPPHTRRAARSTSGHMPALTRNAMPRIAAPASKQHAVRRRRPRGMRTREIRHVERAGDAVDQAHADQEQQRGREIDRRCSAGSRARARRPSRAARGRTRRRAAARRTRTD